MENPSIAQKNDLARQTMRGCRVVLTASLSSSQNLEAIIEAVRKFDKFTNSNDPYFEHDFSFFIVDGERYFFKFDYYDDRYEFFQEDGNRVITIGRADEY